MCSVSFPFGLHKLIPFAMKRKNSHNMKTSTKIWREMFVLLFTRPTKQGMHIMYGEEWLMKKENLNFINCIYLFIIFCLLITLSIFSQRIHKSIEVVWLKRTIHFYIQWHKEIFIDYEDTREPLLGSMSTSWWCQCHFSLGSFETITNKKLCIFLQKML